MKKRKPNENFSYPKNAFYAFCVTGFAIFLLLTSFYLESDKNTGLKQIISKTGQFNSRFPAEKLYLHTDRPSYWAGEELWFKSYLLNGASAECNLYVELLNSSGKIINKNLCWSQNGLSYGSFRLADTLSSGVYQIRAYTDWMRNFDEEWFFRKNLVIWGYTKKSISSKNNEIKANDIDLRFFPEGGAFIANVANRVAFKAVDQNGKGLDVEGEIKDTQGNKIAGFRSHHNGMGSFVLTPSPQMAYTAEALVSGIIFKKVELPVAKSKGVRMFTDSYQKEKINIEIAQTENLSETNLLYFMVGQSGGEIVNNTEILMTNNKHTLEINRDSLPTGITKFTLFNSDLIPVCERLVFVNHHDFIPVEIIPQKEVYNTREKIELTVKTVDSIGNPNLSSLSLSVYNPDDQLETEAYPENIMTCFLLNSELRGRIEEPGWYFEDDSINTLEAIDNLMLTHGYRYFQWEKIINDEYPEIEYQPESSIRIKGTVSSVFSKKPRNDIQTTLLFLKSQLAVYQENTDSHGQFIFNNLFFFDTVFVAVQAGKYRNRSKYWIELDNRNAISPQPTILPVNYQYIKEKPVNTTYFLSEENLDLINRKWHLNDTIILGDINILANKPEEKTIHLRPYVNADYIYEISENDDDMYSGIIEMLENLSAYMRNFLNRDPQFFLDGVMADAGYISGMPATWFEKVEAVKMAPVRNGIGPGLFFYTKRGDTHKKSYEGLGKASAKVSGYSVIRQFYSPNYAIENAITTKNDFRNTIYWNPLVRTDSTGVAQVAFYTSDDTGNFRIEVEGITSDKKICRGTISFNVQ